MNYHNITTPDMLNGEGLRTVLWVSGCRHNCPGCHNPETHSFSSGLPFTQEVLDEFLDKCEPSYISGATFTGGDPLMEENAPKISEIIQHFKARYPSKTIWIYTGWTFEQLIKMDNFFINYILENIDVLVDGRFIIARKDPLLHFRGSTNQRIIDVKKTLENNNVPVEYVI